MNLYGLSIKTLYSAIIFIALVYNSVAGWSGAWEYYRVNCGQVSHDFETNNPHGDIHESRT